MVKNVKILEAFNITQNGSNHLNADFMRSKNIVTSQTQYIF